MKGSLWSHITKQIIFRPISIQLRSFSQMVDTRIDFDLIMNLEALPSI